MIYNNYEFLKNLHETTYKQNCKEIKKRYKMWFDRHKDKTTEWLQNRYNKFIEALDNNLISSFTLETIVIKNILEERNKPTL